MSYTYVVITITDEVWCNTQIYKIYKTKIIEPFKFIDKVEQRIKLIRKEILKDYSPEEVKRFDEENTINYKEINDIYKL